MNHNSMLKLGGNLEGLRTHEHCAIRIHFDADVKNRLAELTRAIDTALFDGLPVK